MADEPLPASAERGGARTTQRRGRMSAGKRSALDALAPRWLLDPTTPLTDHHLCTVFGRAAPRLLDIGVGNGEATRAWAEQHPDHDVVAVELHRPGIVALARALEAEGPPGIRVVEADVLGVLAATEPGAFTHVRVLFPDPWPKRRHVGRRLVEEGFVRLVTDRLPPGGTLSLATDWDDYAHQMRASLATERRLAPVPGASPADPWRHERPDRPITAYEQRGLDAGRTITDLVACRATS